jgi:hypothetical protein
MGTIYLFPGEGRGPVGKHSLASDSACYICHPDWAPTFAGEHA